MATALELMGLGLPAAQAGAIGQTTIGTLAATGSDQAGAAAVVSALTRMTTASAGGALLPRASGKPVFVIYNNSGNTVTVYPTGTETINNTTSFSLADGKVGAFFPGSSAWLGLLGA